MIHYHASHEQFSPSQLLKWSRSAELAGFDGIHSSDHFQPWSERQGQSGFTFAWMGAALQATGIPCGMICAPGPRYHPAVIAQAAATLTEMFPERFWLELGSGEAINESITGELWPTKEQRDKRLLESVGIIRRLLAGETVSYQGIVKVQEARLYTLPVVTPKIIGAALSIDTARWVGGWADGLVTVHKEPHELKKLINAFRMGGGEGKPVYVKVQLSYASTEAEALEGAYEQWRTNILPPDLAADFYKVSHFDAVADYLKPEDLHQHILISSSLEKYVHWLKSYQELGIDCLILHNVNRAQESFIKDFGQEVLPQLKSLCKST